MIFYPLMFPLSSIIIYEKWYTRIFTDNRVHRDVCIIQILLEFSLTWIWLIWLLAFPMPWDRSNSTFHYPFGSYIRNPLVHWRQEERIESKETTVHCWRNLCLSLHPIVPWSTSVFFPSLPFACDIAIKRWRIQVVEAQVGDSVSPVRKRAIRGCIL